jgi:type II secretory pathway pseudopilin PulG
MIGFHEEKGSSLIEIIAALILFSMVAAGLAIAIPMAYGRVTTWQAQFNLARYLEKQLEEVRSSSFVDLTMGDTLLQTEDNNNQYRWITSYVKDDSGNKTWAASAPGTGDGLTGTYYDTTNAIVKQLDSNVDPNWTGPPVLGISDVYFSVRWTGYVEPLEDGNYIFYMNVDNAVRLWVNNQLLIDKWVNGAPFEWSSGPITLTANVRYPIKIEYYHATGIETAQLSWSGPSFSETIIPQSQLYSYGVKMTVVTVNNSTNPLSLTGRVLTFDNDGVTPGTMPIPPP